MIFLEPNTIWAPIRPQPRPLWQNNAEIIEAYQAASPVRVSRSQRYSLVLTEPEPKDEP